mmetsp:Transcript_2570/g.6011  ORF Transcript_2570/g.6011 Transcript_2570/m.6011 type:complete len:180 (+) Transcript_2570:59-598(+)
MPLRGERGGVSAAAGRSAPPRLSRRDAARHLFLWALVSACVLGVGLAMGSIGRVNVLGGVLQKCSRPGGPVTGFFRDGCCTTGDNDVGRHVVCSKMTQEFLAFTRSRGNDLSSPAPQYGFPGLRPGDFWCLCASRWKEAFQHGVAPPVCLEATDEAALRIVSLEDLQAHALSEEQEGEL